MSGPTSRQIRPSSSVYGRVGADVDEEEQLDGEEIELQTAYSPKEVVKPKDTAESEVARNVVIFAVILYAACSSTLLVINKVAMHLVPDAPFLLFCQFTSSTLFVRGLMCSSPDMDIEEMKWEKVKPFSVVTLLFFLCLLSNTQALHFVNVETVIVVRSCSPICVALLEKVVLQRPLPSPHGMAALLAIAGGATVYVLADEGFKIAGYAWLIVYFAFIVAEMVFVKLVVETLHMSTWTRVYYNNTLSIPMAMLSAVSMGSTRAFTITWTAPAFFAVGLSCIVGVAISYAGFNLRKLVSATSFTVIGVICKLLTVLINDVIWAKHSNALGHIGLFICICAGFTFEKVKNWK